MSNVEVVKPFFGLSLSYYTMYIIEVVKIFYFTQGQNTTKQSVNIHYHYMDFIDYNEIIEYLIIKILKGHTKYMSFSYFFIYILTTKGFGFANTIFALPKSVD